MCKVGGGKGSWKNYNQRKSTEKFLDALESEVGIPTTLLVYSKSADPLKRAYKILPDLYPFPQTPS